MNEVPKKLDWVKARVECSIENLIGKLIEVVKKDQESASERIHNATFKFATPSTGGIMVSRHRSRAESVEIESVTFVPSEDVKCLVVTRHAGKEVRELFRAGVHVDDQGTCRLAVDGAPLELWQISKRALEDLFFG